MKRILQSVTAFSIAFLIGYTFTPIPASVMAQISPPWSGGGGGGTTFSSTVAAAALTCIDSGANDTYACDLTPAPANYAAILGLPIAVRFNTANTGAATLNINGIGAQAIVTTNNLTANQALATTGEILATSWGVVQWDGTNFQLTSTPGSNAKLRTNQTWSGTQTFGAQVVLTSALGFISWGTTVGTSGSALFRTNKTPDAPVFETGSLSNSYLIYEVADSGFDFNNGACGTAACTDPTVNIHSHNQDTQEYIGISHDGVSGNIVAGNSTQKAGQISIARTVALTEAGGAETVLTITTATTQSFGLELSYQVRAADATPDYAIREGSLKYVCVNNATVVTCTKDATAQTDDESVIINTNAKTLTYAIASDVATANVAKITFDIDSDMTVTGASITMTIVLNGSGVIS